MKRYPLDVVQQHETARYEQFAKLMRFDTLLFVLLEVDTRFCEQLYRLLGKHVVAVQATGLKRSHNRSNITTHCIENLKLNCQVQTPSGVSPFSSQKLRPS